ncbi:UNVERIFIED_CONTAM: hypothetical protein Sradi_5885200 [Sesamum radiatum]|uniref:DUF4283 domain-containing protein n=1 Tax=Sesamum radiatum TaxID=300843 RepID=A0AAW2KSX4_SESRA
MEATKGMEIQLFYPAVKPIVSNRKGKSLKQMKIEEVYRLLKKLKQFGAVCHGINYAESDEEENSYALFTGPQFDTEQGEQGVPSTEKPSPIASRTRCRKKGKNAPTVYRQRRLTGKGTLHPQLGRVPPLNSANPPESLPESTLPNSSKTQSSHAGKSFSHIVGSHSANRDQLQQTNFGKFFLADSEPNAIGACHNINGRPTITFSDDETQSLVADFRLALIGKFSHGIPPYSQLHRLLTKTGITGKFTVSLINKKHALISLSKESDFTRLWMRRIWYLNGFPMRVFKWSPTFTPENESSITPIWVRFPELPAHLFRKDALFAIANNIGTPLQIADSTFYQYNLANARVCVEIDLLKSLLKEIDLKICGATIVQNIVDEQIPNYCSLCKHVGHRDAECYSKGDAAKPPPNRRTAAAGKQKMKEKAVAQYVIKGKNVVEYQARQAFDKIPEKKLTVTEVGECHSKDVNVEATFEVMNRTHAIEANNGCDENHSVAIEIDAKDSLETVYELEELQENIVKPIDSVGTLIIRPNNFVCDLMRGKKRIKVDSVFRLLQTLKQVGVVIKGIKEDVEEAIKRNRLAVSSAILFQKCVLLYDPVRQLYLKPLDTGEQSRQVLQDFDLT